VLELRKTDRFDAWLQGLKDLRARARVQARLDRLALGNPGDVRSVGEGVSELRVDHGPGYRVYYVRHGEAVVLLLCGGDKRTQVQDIKTAKRMVRELKE
jgi:putative addiction module killer protein